MWKFDILQTPDLRVFFGYVLFIPDQVLKYVIQILENQRDNEKTIFLSGLWSGVSILLGEGSEECLLRFCFVIFAPILDIFQSCHSVVLVCWHYFNILTCTSTY
jgi:hypothetical protein